VRILIVGAGSTGGYFGARLMQAGRDVTFLVRPARAAALRETGLQVVSPLGDFGVTPKLVLASDLKETFDIVLVTVKAFGLAAAIEDFAAAVGPGTLILTVLNGMKHVDDLQARFGADRVVGGVCRVSTQLDAQGRILHLSPMHELIYGELDGSRSARIEALHAFLSDAGFTTQLSTHIAQDLWNKWILLASPAGSTCSTGPAGDAGRHLFAGARHGRRDRGHGWRRRFRARLSCRSRGRRHRRRLRAEPAGRRFHAGRAHRPRLAAHVIDVPRPDGWRSCRGRPDPGRPARAGAPGEPGHAAGVGRFHPAERVPAAQGRALEPEMDAVVAECVRNATPPERSPG
jgi:hypothetical protein